MKVGRKANDGQGLDYVQVSFGGSKTRQQIIHASAAYTRLKVNLHARRQTYARIGVKEPQMEGHIGGRTITAAREQYRVTQAQDTRGWSATRCLLISPHPFIPSQFKYLRLSTGTVERGLI